MKRVFFYTGYHMEVFEFDENIFLGALDFFDTEEGVEEFKGYLSNAVPAQSYMLVDLQDEDFRTEHLPHVRGPDRKNIIARMEKKIFRDLQYCQSVNLGRSKDGRRDDLYMFSSLLNAEALDRWMEIFNTLNVPICGIWSVSYLSEQIISKLGIQDEHVLLFSRQMRSAVRETIFRKGKLLISRQAKLERRVRDDATADTLASILTNNVDTMHRFLINQRLISFADTLSVYALARDDQIDTLRPLCTNTATLNFNFVSIKELFLKFKIKNCERPAVDILLAYLCSTKKPSQQQYLPVTHRGPYQSYRMGTFIQSMSAVLTICFVLLGTFMLLNAHEFDVESNILSQRKMALQNEYASVYSPRQIDIDNAETIKQTVELAHEIERYNAVTPQSKFLDLARTFQKNEFSRFSLDQFIWQKYSPRQLQAITSEFIDPAKIASQDDMFIDDEFGGEEYFQPVLRLQGRLDKKGLSYDQSVSLMDRFIQSITDFRGLERLHILDMPIDVRAGKKFTDRGGIEMLAKMDEPINNRYELRLILAPLNSTGFDNESL